MKVIVCLDDTAGMLFGGRRQSKDRLLREDMLNLTAGSILWMDEYSFRQFTEEAQNIRVDGDFLSLAGPEDFCFVERADISHYADRVSGVILYRWNRAYPADIQFPVELFSSKWSLASSEEFPGFSHEVITREVYAL